MRVPDYVKIWEQFLFCLEPNVECCSFLDYFDGKEYLHANEPFKMKAKSDDNE